MGCLVIYRHVYGSWGLRERSWRIAWLWQGSAKSASQLLLGSRPSGSHCSADEKKKRKKKRKRKKKKIGR